MESDFQITIKGLPEERAILIGNAVARAVSAFKQADESLDFRRMHRIILTADLAGELRELSSETASRNLIAHTEEEYAVAVAKVIILPHEDGLEIVPIVNALMAAALVPEDTGNYDEENFGLVLHLLHHELCHVHDDNKKIDALDHLFLRHQYVGKDNFIRPLAEACWSEYIANILSSSTARADDITTMIEMFTDAISRTKPTIDSEILSYRDHADLEHLLGVFHRHGEFLVKTAAYLMGYIDGLGKSLSEFSIDAKDRLSGSYFEPTWKAMSEALKKMLQIYPEGWKGLNVYDDLAAALEDYYDRMGFILSTTEDGHTYVDIPFRPETTPHL